MKKAALILALVVLGGCKDAPPQPVQKHYSGTLGIVPDGSGQVYVSLSIRVDAVSNEDAVAKAIKYMQDCVANQAKVEMEEKVQK